MDNSLQLPASVIQTITTKVETIKRQESQAKDLNVSPIVMHGQGQ